MMDIQEGEIFGKSHLSPIEKTGEVDPDFSKKRRDFEDFIEEEKDEEPLIDGLASPYQNPFIQETSLSPSFYSSEDRKGEAKDLLTNAVATASKKGVGKTHLMIQTKSLSLVEVMIDYYDTDPSSFYIRLMGDSEAQKFFQSHRIFLQTALTSALPSFHCTLAPFSFRARSFLSERGRKNSLEKSPHLSYREDKEGKDLYE